MFPNPQDALELPVTPSIEHYRKLAKALVKACESGTSAAWANRWAPQAAEFATQTMTGEGRQCVLAGAQFVLACCDGFRKWAACAAYLEALTQSDTQTGAFEAPADAIVRGDEQTLQQL